MEFWNRVVLDFMELAKLIRSPNVYEETPKGGIPNPNEAAAA
jgi:hypothetical protein